MQTTGPNYRLHTEPHETLGRGYLTVLSLKVCVQRGGGTEQDGGKKGEKERKKERRKEREKAFSKTQNIYTEPSSEDGRIGRVLKTGTEEYDIK